MRTIMFLALTTVFVGGCASLRLAPTEAQKQNAWSHMQTARLAALKAEQEDCSPALYNLAALGARQAEVFVADYGMPRDLPLTATAEADWQAVDEAMRDSRHGPDGWAVADGILELAAGLAGLLGGVCGAKVLRFVSEARVKSTALKEIVEGNELFKKRNPGVAPDFKEAHSSQSSQTRQLVTALK